MKTSRKTEYVIQRFSPIVQRWEDYNTSGAAEVRDYLLVELRKMAMEDRTHGRYRAVNREIINTYLDS